MQNNNAQPYNEENQPAGERTSNNSARDKMDLTDSKRDQERLQPDEATINLPDVKDIPGQEFVHVPPLGMMADTTISSADEEGDGLFDDEDEDEINLDMSTEGNVTQNEKKMLEKSEDNLSKADKRLRRATMDSTDFEGVPLNEGSFGPIVTGSDLDTATSPDDSTGNALQSDEENKIFSLGGDRQDKNEER